MDDTTTSTGISVTTLLRQRHAEVKGMFDQLLQSSGDERRELFDCLRAAMAVHETAEEIVVHPKVRTFDAEAQRAVDARLAEEQLAKRALADLEEMGTEDPAFIPNVKDLRNSVVAHAEAEEREIFPRVEEHCSAEEQARMADRIRTAEKMAPTHPHPHGPSSATGNMLVGPFAAMADKVRDALSK